MERVLKTRVNQVAVVHYVGVHAVYHHVSCVSHATVSVVHVVIDHAVVTLAMSYMNHCMMTCMVMILMA